VTQVEHLADDVLSVLVDERLSPAESQAAREHLATCASCSERLAELRTLSGLLRALPEVDLPRDFSIGPRPVAEPANVIRLQRWYTWARAGAASLAAVFVFLVAGTVFLDSGAVPSRPTTAFQASSGEGAVAANAPRAAAPALAPATAATPAPTTAPNAPPAAPAQAPAPAPAAALRDAAPAAAGAQAQAKPAPQSAASQPAAAEAPASTVAATTPQTTDQTAAATSVQPLPTVAPMPPPTAAAVAPAPAALAPPSPPVDLATPLRVAASIVGFLAVLALLGALVARHRLSRARAPLPPQE
jgi:hypothetical protein